MKEFDYQKQSDGVVVITINMIGAVNTMTSAYTEAMASALDKLEADTELVGVILTSGKDSFFAGGDLDEILSLTIDQEQAYRDRLDAIKALHRRLETLPVPVVAAINGSAIGSGIEIALSCHHRIALDQPSTKIGLPEATLGLSPGTGGVVRLTQLLGLKAALPILLDGQLYSVSEACRLGLVDQTVGRADALLPAAQQWLLDHINNPDAARQPWDKDGYQPPGDSIEQLTDFIQTTTASVLKKTRGLLPAPAAIITVAEQALCCDLDTALHIESHHCAALAVRPETQNLITAHFIQHKQVARGASRPKGFEKNTINKLGIIGAGMMGQGIAYVAAKSGIEVILKDISRDAADKGKAYSATVSNVLIARGEASEADKVELLNRITATDRDSDLEGCDLIIEAVFENMPLKKNITQANEGFLNTDGVWGTNTSTLPITQLAEVSAKPANFVGLHFFSPVDRMRLVEIICGEKTADDTLAKAFDFVQQIHKTPIVVNDSVGFFTSRVFGVPLEEGAQMVAEGIHPERVETLAKALGMPVGPLTSYDEISLRLIVEINETQEAMGLKNPQDDVTPEATALTRRLLKEDQRPGRHYGGGFYEYHDNGKALWPTLIERYYQPEIDQSVSDQDIKDRLLFRAVIESLKCLEEGVLRSVADGNIGALYGIGAPKWTGGYIQFVNTYGLQRFIDRCDQLTQRYGARFNAPNIVHQKLTQGDCFD